MKKNFLLLLLMSLLPLAGWAQSAEFGSMSLGKYTYGSATLPVPVVKDSEGSILADDIHYVVTDGAFSDAECTTPIAVTAIQADGTKYYRKVTGKTATAYEGKSATAYFTADKAALTVTVTMSPAAPEKVYDGTTDKPAGVSVASWSATGWKNGDTKDDCIEAGTIAGEIQWSYTNPNAGNRAITFSGLTAKNYEITYEAKTISITQKPLAAGMVTAKSFTVNYKGAVYTPNTDFAVVVKDGTKTLSQGTDYAVKVYSDEEMNTEVASPRNFGTYYVGVVGQAGTNYGGGPIAVGTLTINKANLTVLANNQDADYDGTSTVQTNFDEDDYQYIGLVGTDVDGDITGTTLQIAAADLTKKVAGSYTITPSGSTNANYNIYFQPGTFTINRVPLTITADDKIMTLGGAEPEYTITITGAVLEEETTMRGTGDGQGKAKAERAEDDDDTIGDNHVIEVSYNEDADVFANYIVTPVNGKLTINGGTIVVTVKPQTITYGDEETWSEPQEGRDYFVNGIADADKDKLNVTLTRANASKKTPGTYAITASANTPEGYGNVEYVNSTLTINKKTIYAIPQDVSLSVGNTLEDLNIIGYDEVIFNADGDVDNDESALVGDDVISYKLVFKSGVTTSGDAGTKAQTITAIDAGAKISVELVNAAGDYFIDDNANANYTIIVTTTANLTDGAGTLTLDRNDANLLSKLAAADGKTYDVEFTNERTLKAQKWYSMVLPFDISVAQLSSELGYALVNRLNTTTSDSNVHFTLAWGTIPANEPFLVKVQGTETPDGFEDIDLNTITFTDVEITDPEAATVTLSHDGINFIGVYEQKHALEAGDKFYAGTPADKPYEVQTAPTTLSPFASFWSAPAGARVFVEDIDENGVTAITEVSTSAIDAIAADGWYTLGGVKLQAAPTEKGVYIKDGKKFVIK